MQAAAVQYRDAIVVAYDHQIDVLDERVCGLAIAKLAPLRDHDGLAWPTRRFDRSGNVLLGHGRRAGAFQGYQTATIHAPAMPTRLWACLRKFSMESQSLGTGCFTSNARGALAG